MAGSTTAELFERPVVATAVQLVEPSSEYCQAPSVADAPLPMMATPASGVASVRSRVSS